MKITQKTLSPEQTSVINAVDVAYFAKALKSGGLTPDLIAHFQSTIYNNFNHFGRTFSWRENTNPYYILVSEIMLQQTQTYRVQGKFEEFIEQFPDFETLAQASVAQVVAAWQGLGYNRRALALQKCAQKVVTEFEGELPNNPELLKTFPGIGPNTAGSICAFAFNVPTIFIETNVRSVFIHFFFYDVKDIKDDFLMPLIEKTVDQENPRLWYYALMDYGVALKKMYTNPSRKSAHHTKQSAFEGSDRQIRGAVLRLLVKESSINQDDLLERLGEPERVENILNDLQKDGFIKILNGLILLK